MRAILTTTFAMLMASTAAFAQDGVDKVKLRGATRLPLVSFQAGIYFASIQGIVWTDVYQEATEEIAILEKSLKGDDTDAARYARLTSLYSVVGDDKKEDDAYQRSVGIYRRLVKQDPKNGRLLAQLGAVLDNDEKEEAEKLLRRAVAFAPRDWFTHDALGQFLASQMLQTFGLKNCSLEQIMQAIASKQATDETIARAAEYFNEAIKCYDRAIMIAPKETQSLSNRSVLGLYSGFFRAGIQGREGKEVNVIAAVFSGEVINDVVRLSHLRPNDSKALGFATVAEVLSFVMQNPEKFKTKGPYLAGLPDAMQKSVRERLERLSRLAEAQDRQGALAAEVRGFLCLLLGEMKQAEQSLRRAVKLNPVSERAWELLLASLTKDGWSKEALDVCLARLKHKTNARNCIVTAKCYERIDDFAKAEEKVREGIKQDPKDLPCNLGLAALLLRKDDPTALQEAQKLLDFADRLVDDKTTESAKNDLAATRGVYLALTGEVEKGRKLLEEVIKRDSDHVCAKKALEAIGR